MANNKDSTMVPLNKRSHRLPDARMVQNFYLVWLDESINEVNDNDCRNSIIKLRQVVNTFSDIDECIDFITDIEEKVFVIISEQCSQTIIPIIQDISQIGHVYIFCENNSLFEKWTKEWPKLSGVYKDITQICETLK
jgi:hypothetical protein